MSEQQHDIFNYEDSSKIVREMTDDQRAALIYQISLRDYILQQEMIKGNFKQLRFKHYSEQLKHVQSKEDMKKLDEEVDKVVKQFCYFYEEQGQEKKEVRVYINNISMMMRYCDFNITKEQFIQYIKEFDAITKSMMEAAKQQEREFQDKKKENVHVEE